MSTPKRRKNDTSTGTVPLLMLTVNQACEALQLHYDTVVRMCGSGELAAIKCGREWRIPVAEVNALIKDLMDKAAEKRAEKAAAAA